MRLILMTCFLLGLCSASSINPGSKNGIRTKVPSPDFDVVSNNGDPEIRQRRNSGYIYNRPIRLNRPDSTSRLRAAFSNLNQSKRPFTKYGLPTTSQEQKDFSQQQPRNQHRPFTQNQQHDYHVQDLPDPIKIVVPIEESPIASQNNQPFSIGTANYLPPSNQKLPSPTFSNVSQGRQIFQSSLRENSQNQRISDAILFLAQNAHSLSQLNMAPAVNQEYAPNDEFTQSTSHQESGNLGQQPGNIQGFPLPSYASGILSPAEVPKSFQSSVNKRLILQLQQALSNQMPFPADDLSGRQFSDLGDPRLTTADGATSPVDLRLVSPNKFGGEQSACGHIPFLSGFTTSPPGYGIEYTSPGMPRIPTLPPTATPPAHEPASDGNQSGSSGSTASSGVLQSGRHIPTLIPGTNLFANVPISGSEFPNLALIPPPNSPAETSSHFGISVPTFSGQKPTPGTSIFTLSSTSPSPPSGRPGVQILNPDNPVPEPGRPSRPVSSPVPTTHPVSIPTSFPAQTILQIGTYRPVATPIFPAVAPVHPSYGIQSSTVNLLLARPFKATFPGRYYPHVPLQYPNPTLAVQPWNYAPSFHGSRVISDWK